MPNGWTVLGDSDSSVVSLLTDGGVSVDGHADLASLARSVKDGSPPPDLVLWERPPAVGAPRLDNAVRDRAHEACLSYSRLGSPSKSLLVHVW